jgi:hypothetical protein
LVRPKIDFFGGFHPPITPHQKKLIFSLNPKPHTPSLLLMQYEMQNKMTAYLTEANRNIKFEHQRLSVKLEEIKKSIKKLSLRDYANVANILTTGLTVLSIEQITREKSLEKEKIATEAVHAMDEIIALTNNENVITFKWKYLDVFCEIQEQEIKLNEDFQMRIESTPLLPSSTEESTLRD